MKRVIGLIGMLAALSGCDRTVDAEPPAATPVAQPLPDPGPTMAEGLEIEADARYDVDRERPEVELPVRGSARHRLVARLVDEAGRRELVLVLPNGASEVVAEPDWYARGAAVAAASGDVTVCYNRLVGRASAWTHGDMPDPRLGVDLWCRAGTPGAWSAPARLARTRGAHWLANMVAAPGGVNVVYLADSGGTLLGDSAEGDGTWRVRFAGDRFRTPELVRGVAP